MFYLLRQRIFELNPGSHSTLYSSLLQAGQDHGYVCVVMEVMESGLDRLFRHRLTREEYTHVALSILRGLQALHARNLVHGDLHKNNVLYNRYGMVKLADYGKVTAPAGVRSAGPQVPPGEGGAGQLIELMVPSYMRPPELLLGSKEITPAIDVWCFGILLVQLAAGESTLLRSGQISYADEGSPHPERRYRYFLQILRSYADLTGHPAVPHGLRSLPRCQSIPHVLGVDTISRALVDLPNGLHSSLRSDRISALKDRLGPHWWPLVKSCLHPDPSQRPRVADLVSHPFFDGAVWVSLPLA